MAKVSVLNQTGAQVGEIELNDAIFAVEIKEHLVHQAVVAHLANRRQGTQSARTRSEVRGGGRKPWKQKGTGRARQGSIRAVQWVGGGIAFGPTPRSYSKKQNRKERRLALKSAWTYKAKEGAITVVDAIKLETPKTKEIINILNNLKLNDTKTMIVVKEYEENLILASRNLQNIVVVLPSEISVLDLVSSNKVLITVDALDEVKEALK